MICGRFAQGRKLRDICKSRYLPNASTVMDWVIKHPEFYERWQRAKKLRADWFAQKTIDAAESATPETIGVDRLKVDVYRWHASKLDTQAYGDKATEIHANTTVNNFVVLPIEKQRELQAQRLEALQR